MVVQPWLVSRQPETTSTPLSLLTRSQLLTAMVTQPWLVSRQPEIMGNFRGQMRVCHCLPNLCSKEELGRGRASGVGGS